MEEAIKKLKPYINFVNDSWSAISQKHPSLTIPEVQKQIFTNWQNLKKTQKIPGEGRKKRERKPSQLKLLHSLPVLKILTSQSQAQEGQGG